MIFIYAIIALLITFILVPILIPTLKRMKFGQSIREEGPQSHMKKTGTPTMGGLTFLISIIISSIIAIIFLSFLAIYEKDLDFEAVEIKELTENALN